MSVSRPLAWLLLIIPLTFVAGCNREGDLQEYSTAPESEPREEHDHAHAHGPHDGHLIELGEEQYHAELVFDKETRKTTIYILAGDAKTSHAIEGGEVELHLEVGDGETELVFAAAPQDDDPEGKSSRFELTADQLPEAVDDEEKFVGHIHVTIGDESFAGDISHDHGHPHDHDDEAGHDKDDDHGKHKDDAPAETDAAETPTE